MTGTLDRVRERGFTTTEFAVLFPLLMLFMLLPFQVAFWYNARETALLAAEEAASIVALEGGDTAKATTVANNLLANGSLLSDQRIQIEGVGSDEVTVTVHGNLAWRILPFPAQCRGTVTSSDRTVHPGERTMTTRHQRTVGERGVLTSETAVGVFVVFMMVSLVIYAGRISVTGNQVRNAAHDAARAASVEPDPASAQAAATALAAANLDSLSCRGGATATLSGDFAPGGIINVTLTCVVDLSDLTFLPVPGSQTLTYTSIEVIDAYRADNL